MSHKEITQHCSSMYDLLAQSREARWDIINRMNKLMMEAYEKQQLLKPTIKSISKNYTQCKYCGCINLRWADTTKGYRLVNLLDYQHVCKQETKSE